MPGRTAPLSPNPATASQQIAFAVDTVTQVPTILFGWSFTESTGSAAAKVRLHDGTSASAPELTSTIDLASGTSNEENFEEGIEVTSGAVYLDVISGSVEGLLIWG